MDFDFIDFDFINVGFGSYVLAAKVVAIVGAHPAPVKRPLQSAYEQVSLMLLADEKLDR